MGFADRPYYGQRQAPGLGGLMVPGGRSVAMWLLVVNIGLFFLDGFLRRMQHGVGSDQMSFVMEWGHFSFHSAVQQGQIWRFLTYQFLHFDGWHLFGNLLALFFFAPMVEQHLGSRRFLLYYLLCGMAGAVLFLILLGVGQAVPPERIPFLLVASPTAAMVGASGAVFGVLIAALRIAPNSTVLLFFVIPVPLRVLILLILLVEVYALMVGGRSSGGSAAHLGGALVGALLIRRAHWLNWADRLRAPHLSPARLKHKARKNALERRLRREQDFEQEVDRILEKVAREGLHSLTWKEKRTLQKATEKQRQ